MDTNQARRAWLTKNKNISSFYRKIWEQERKQWIKEDSRRYHQAHKVSLNKRRRERRRATKNQSQTDSILPA